MSAHSAEDDAACKGACAYGTCGRSATAPGACGGCCGCLGGCQVAYEESLPSVLPSDLAVSLNVCPPCAQALHDLCTRALAPCDCPEHEGEA